MDFQELLKLALGSLRANKLRSALTTLGIIIGVFSVIILVALGSGLQKYITDQISGLGSNILFVIPGKVGSQQGPGEGINRLTIANTSYLLDKLGQIAYSSPVVSKVTTVKFANKNVKNSMITGVSSDYPLIIKTELIRGTFFSKIQAENGSNVAVIGKTVKDTLFPNSDPIGKKISFSNGKYTVIGVAGEKGSVFGQDQDNTVIIPFQAARKQFSITTVNTIYLAAKAPEFVNLVKKQATRILASRLEEDDFTIMTQEQTLQTVTTITSTLTTALAGIAAISLLVGGIGVMNIMLVSVTERTKEIGLRKALGAKRADILLQFLLEAIILSLSGGLVGIILGFAASLAVSYFFVADITIWSVMLAFVFSVVVGIIFGIAPAISASKLSPIEALRYE